MRWDDHFILFGLGVVVIIIAFVLFGQTEGLDFNSIISNFIDEVSEILEPFGIPMELFLVILLFAGIFILLKATTKI